MQFPELQAAVMCEVEQADPQPPQFPTEVFVFVSQVKLLSQSAVPAAQVEDTHTPPESVYPTLQAVATHVPVLQEEAEAFEAAQVTPQAPQFEVVVRLVSQPSLCLFALQSA